jgi:membrane-associated phospholipid phosphatase
MDPAFRPLLHIITDFGDSAVLAAAVLFGTIALYAAKLRRSARRFALAFLVTGFLIGCAKIAFIGCGGALGHALRLRSPSGHTSLSTVFFASIASTIQPYFYGLRKQLIWLTTLAAIGLIGASRVLLGYHSINETIFGVLLGFGVWYAFYRRPMAAKLVIPIEKKHILIFGAAILIAVAAVHGRHLPAEYMVTRLAWHVHELIPFCSSD